MHWCAKSAVAYYPPPFLSRADRQGIKHAEQENVAIRAAARQAAVAALEATQGPKPLPPQNAAFASSAGTGQYAAVGFSYGGDAGADQGGGGQEAEGYEEDEEDSDDDVPVTAGWYRRQGLGRVPERRVLAAFVASLVICASGSDTSSLH